MARRYWGFTNMNFEYEGYNVTELYRATWQALADRAYFTTERKYIYVSIGDVQGVVAWWTGTYEAEKKYSLTGIDAYLKIIWRMVPKPGASGENPPRVPYGKFSLSMNGFVVTDYLNTWAQSLLLSPLFDLRERIFYKRRVDVLKKKVRQDGEGIIRDLQEVISFLPRLM